MATDLREDLAAFSLRVLGRELWPHQLAAAQSDAFITVVAKARRTGGTVLAESMAAHVAFAYRGARVVVLSATQDAARRLTESIGQTLNASRLTRGAVVDSFSTRIRLSNASEIISLPASQRQVRGLGERVRLVILDEAGFQAPELWRAAHYLALDERGRGSRILMVGTPWGGPGHFFRQSFEAGKGGDPDHESFHWKAEVNPNLDAAYLERMRHRVSPAEFASEILGEWSDAVGSLFPRELLERQTADVELPRLDQLCPPARPIVGFDWGVSFDRSAEVAVYRLPVAALNPATEPRPRFIAIPRVWPAGTPLSDVVREGVHSNAVPRFVATEVNGVGAGPSQQLVSELRETWPDPSLACTWYLVPTSSASKTASYGALLSLLEQGQLVLPRDPDLLRQLAGLRFEQGERGFTRIEAENPAVHDDIADALALCALPRRPRSGRVRCDLATLSRSEVAPPDASLPELEEEVIETSGGLRLYRRPFLQSVTGMELTTPPGVRRRSDGTDLEDLRARVRVAMQRGQKEATT